MINKHLLFFSFILIFLLSSAHAQTNHIVDVSNFVFTPANLTITEGDTVTWKWVSGSHTTTSDSTTGVNSWTSPINSTQQTFSFVITSPGLHRYYCKFHGGPNGVGMSGTITVTSPTAVSDNSTFPDKYNLSQNYPNPFNPTTTIKYALPVSSYVSIKVFNSVGNEIATLVNEQERAGYYNISFDGKNYPSGVYFLQFKANSFLHVEKMILLK
jgi:plastocyanin